eukprot:comp5269_c0_seq1/m.1294 comp5269_c0_seq1/g.1294  ORF comp5269_c0_seq1/g.1294 comp5269_c0_seq1/m.1294 type:complete len:441 (-) comp5269_c0_seq1:92-1414(-)
MGEGLVAEEIALVRYLVFGLDTPEDVLDRWRQGFVFAPSPAAAVLVQAKGGPCAVLAPVQAYIIDYLLFSSSNGAQAASDWANPSEEQQTKALANAMATIIAQAAATSGRHPTLVMEEGSFPHSNFDELHQHLTVCEIGSTEELVMLLEYSLDQFKATNGVILFLYSVILSKGIDQFREDHMDIEDTNQPLVGNFGHASQSIVNLLLHGHAVPNVFDGTMSTGGLVLKGVPEQSHIGFLTILESLHYCEVGALLKSPRRPIWILGSETHYTVLFSENTSLVCPEPRQSKAKRLFQKHDSEGNGFVPTAGVMPLLGEVVASGCCPTIDPTGPIMQQQTQMEVLKKRLDPDGLGVVLLTDFLNIVSPADPNAPSARIPSHFELQHYNGLALSSKDGLLGFRKASATYDGNGEAGGAGILGVLRTKWRGLLVTWDGDKDPSIN